MIYVNQKMKFALVIIGSTRADLLEQNFLNFCIDIKYHYRSRRYFLYIRIFHLTLRHSKIIELMMV